MRASDYTLVFVLIALAFGAGGICASTSYRDGIRGGSVLVGGIRYRTIPLEDPR